MSYANDPKMRRRDGAAFEPSADWQEFTRRRLMWLYDDRARAYGLTAQAQSDMAAWRNLGRGRDAA